MTPTELALLVFLAVPASGVVMVAVLEVRWWLAGRPRGRGTD